MAALTALAPHVKIVVHQRSRSEYRDALEQDIVELAIGQLPTSHTDFLQQHLTDEHFVCILRSGHPRIDNFTLDAYLQARHVVIGAPAFSETHIRKALGAMANRRQVALEVGHYLVVPPIIAETDLVAIVSDTVANYFRGHSAIASVPVPFELPPIIFRQFWHERTNLDPGCQWLRKVISKVLA
jgi:DNA-binding transcriptional LysR family regulator